MLPLWFSKNVTYQNFSNKKIQKMEPHKSFAVRNVRNSKNYEDSTADFGLIRNDEAWKLIILRY